jgi:hypothetical protein
MKPQLVFFKKRSDINNSTFQSGRPFGVVLMQKHFQQMTCYQLQTLTNGLGQLYDILYVQESLVHGWRLPMHEDDVDVIFIGEGWTEAEIAQGKARVIPNHFNQGEQDGKVTQ